MSYLKRVERNSEIVHQVDDEGTIINSTLNHKDKTIVVDTEKEFIFIYSRLLGIINKISEAEIKVLICIVFEIKVNTVQIKIDKKLIDDIIVYTGFTEGSIRNAVSSLANKNILIKDEKYRGYYNIHPDYTWRGDRAGRLKGLRYILTLETREFSTNEEIDKIINEDLKNEE